MTAHGKNSMLFHRPAPTQKSPAPRSLGSNRTAGGKSALWVGTKGSVLRRGFVRKVCARSWAKLQPADYFGDIFITAPKLTLLVQ